MIISKAFNQNAYVLWDEEKIAGTDKLDAHILFYVEHVCSVKGKNGMADVWNITKDFIIWMLSDFSKRHYALSHALSEAEPFCS